MVVSRLRGFRLVLALLAAVTSGTRGLPGEAGATLPPPQWRGGVEVLSEEPPIFVLRGFVTQEEAEQLVVDYDVEHLPEYDVHDNSTSPSAFARCARLFPEEECALVRPGKTCEFLEDPGRFHSPTMAELHSRVAGAVGVPEDNVEAAWFFNWWHREGQGLHLDNYHHFIYPRRIATLLTRLRPDPVGIAFPLARLREHPHSLADDEELVRRLQEEANTLPFKGSGFGRHLVDGPVREAYLDLCRDAPIRLDRGDALLYYHLDGRGAVDVRAMHASCPTEGAQEPKLFISKFIRASSMPVAHGSLRTAHVVSDLRAWIAWQRQVRGLDAAVATLRTQPDQKDPVAVALYGAKCSQGSRTVGPGELLIRPNSFTAAEVLCEVPVAPAGYTSRAAGERFEVKFILLNNGERPWPEGTTLAVRHGDVMGSHAAGIRFPELPVGAVLQLTLPFTAPASPGSQQDAVWSLADPDHRPFGVLMWVDAVVPSVQAESATASSSFAHAVVEGKLGVEAQDPREATGGGLGQCLHREACGIVDDHRDLVLDPGQGQQECVDHWQGYEFAELSSNYERLPSHAGTHRGNPRLCWAKGHRFWLAGVNVLDDNPQFYIFGFCTPHGCTDATLMRKDVVVPWAQRLFANSERMSEARIEVSEWTRQWDVSPTILKLIWAVGACAALATVVDATSYRSWLPSFMRGCSLLVGLSVLTGPRAKRPALCRVIASFNLLVFHFHSYDVYGPPGLPAWLPGFLGKQICVAYHDPVFFVLSVQMLLGGDWSLRTLSAKFARKWVRLAPVGLAWRALLCGVLRGAPVAPFLVDVRPRIDDSVCHVTRCTHHTCTPLYSLLDVLLAFPALDHSGWFTEQDMAMTALLVLSCSSLRTNRAGASMAERGLHLALRFAAAVAIAGWVAALMAALPHCVRPDGRSPGPCSALPGSGGYIDLPEGSMYTLCALLWASSQPGRGLQYFITTPVALAGLAVAAAMDASGLPASARAEGDAAAWYAVSKVLLGISLSALAAPALADGAKPAMAPAWLAALDRLSFGFCVVHVRVLEIIFGYLRPALKEFSWDAYVFDLITMLVMTLVASLFFFLFVQAPLEVSTGWLWGRPHVRLDVARGSEGFARKIPVI